MAAAKPWMKFYPRDWRADEKLRDCGLAARGLWIEMLSLMHASDRYGRLLINGTPPTAERLARQVGAAETEVEALLSELESAGVFSRDAHGVIYSRRMKSDEKTAENARKNGKRGGNPTLCNEKENSAQVIPPDNPPLKAGDKLRGQRPESREGINTPTAVSARDQRLPDDVRQIMEVTGWAHPPGDMALRNDWYAAGATLDQDIVPVLRRETEKLRAKGSPPRFLKVFDAPIREKLEADEREIAHLRAVQRRYQTEEPKAAAGR